MSGKHHSTDEARFEKLYRATRAELLAYLVRRCADPEQAADALAEAYLVAWQKLHSIPDGDRARLWLFGVARNLHLQGVRRRRVGDALVTRLAGELRTSLAPAHTDEPPHQAVHAALETLSGRDREIVTLAAWEGLTPREIADVIGISANAVRIRLHRSRGHLKRHLAEARSEIAPAELLLANREQ